MGFKYNDGLDVPEIFKKQHTADVADFVAKSVEENPEKKSLVAALWENTMVKGTSFILIILILIQLGVAINGRITEIKTEKEAEIYLSENYEEAYQSYVNTNYKGNKWYDDVRAADAVIKDATREKQERTGLETVTLSHEDLELHLSIFANYLRVIDSFNNNNADVRSAMNALMSRLNSELGTDYENFEDYVKDWSHFGKYSEYRETLYNLAASKGYNVEIFAQMGIMDTPSQGGRK